MPRSIHLLPILLLLGMLAGCATMSKEDCLNADWHALGYTDGSRGVHHQYLEKRRESCSEYQVVPDADAYFAGWDQGIRQYCTADNGYRAGRAGQPYRNICPADVEANFLSGWDQGIRQYCTADNGLRLGLAGQGYGGACPPGITPAFMTWYNLGRDVRRARSHHQGLETQLHRHEQQMAAERDPRNRAQLRHQHEQMLRDEGRAYAELLALEACMSGDWFETGYRDAEAGLSRRDGEIAGYCNRYGIGPDRRGYREGWDEGIHNYCSYENGLYIGRANLTYSGTCSGYGHQQFWRGYEEGRRHYRAEQYDYRRPERRAMPPRPGGDRNEWRLRPGQPESGRTPPPSDKRHETKQPEQPAAKKPAPSPWQQLKEPAKAPEQSERQRPKTPAKEPQKETRPAPGRSKQPEAAPKPDKQPEKAPHDNRDKLKKPLPEQGPEKGKQPQQRQKDEKKPEEKGEEGERGNGRD